MYSAASTSLRLSLPSTSIIARPCASVLAPSSSLPPSSNAFPEVPATWMPKWATSKIYLWEYLERTWECQVIWTLNKRSPNNSTELCRIRQLSLKIPSSTAGRRRGKDLTIKKSTSEKSRFHLKRKKMKIALIWNIWKRSNDSEDWIFHIIK